MSVKDPRLDRRIPTDFKHVSKYPASALRRMQRTVQTVEKLMQPPSPDKYQRIYDQGQEGACVGFGESIQMSILNRQLFDALWLYREAQEVDEWTDTPPEQGTSLRAGFDILRDKGHRRIIAGIPLPEMIKHGIVSVNRWLTTTDEGRTAIADGHPMVDGVMWFDGFYPENLVQKRNGQKTEYWIPPREKWGRVQGGHCISRPGASDKRQAFAWLNSWGKAYPWPVYINYTDHEWLLNQQGESAIVTDR
jgi:hypothetical protein